MCRRTSPTLFPYTTLFRSRGVRGDGRAFRMDVGALPNDLQRCREAEPAEVDLVDRVEGARSVRRGEAAAVTEALRRSEEHTSELQSHSELVCRLLLEKKKD